MFRTRRNFPLSAPSHKINRIGLTDSTLSMVPGLLGTDYFVYLFLFSSRFIHLFQCYFNLLHCTRISRQASGEMITELIIIKIIKFQSAKIV